MAKKDIQRGELRQNIMQQALIRIDYTGIISIEEVLKGFKESFKGLFSSYKTTYHNRIELGTLRIDEISESLSVPVKELEQQHIHRFSGNTFGSDELILDISKYYTVLHINCKNYNTVDPYLNFFSDYLVFLKRVSEYTSFKRFGLRKIGSLVLFNEEEVFDNFEKSYFCTPVETEFFGRKGNQYLDVLLSNDGIYGFNHRRVIDKGFFQEGEDIKEAYQVVLDIDGYLTEEKIIEVGFNGVEAIKETIQRLNNVYLFELF